MTDEAPDLLLNMKIVRDGTARTISLGQQLSIEQLLKETNMQDSNPVFTPMDTLSISSADSPVVGSDTWLHMQDVPYRQTVGTLIHIMRSTRPDIAYLVCVLSRYMHNPGTALGTQQREFYGT